MARQACGATIGITSQKSNEPIKKTMIKTIKYLSMAALALVGAIVTGCSSADDSIIDAPQQPENKNNVEILTTTINMDDNAQTRALTSGGVKTFAAGEKLALVYKNTSGNTVKVESAALKTTDIAEGSQSATFTFELTNPDKKQNITYIYPAPMAKADGTVNYAALNSQDGTLETLASNLDLATYSGAWNSTSLPSVTLGNQLAILAITLKNEDGSSDVTSTITGLTLSDGTYRYAVSRSAVAGPIYVAIRPTTSANIEVTATDNTYNYTKSLTSKTYAANNGYNVSWRMTKNAKALSKANSNDIGKLAGLDGKIYADADDATAAGTTAVAKIAYVGYDTGNYTYTHGLALALTDESSSNWSTANTTCQDKNTSTAVDGARWWLPSDNQWETMITTAGSYYNLRINHSLLQDEYWSYTTQVDYAHTYSFLFNTHYSDPQYVTNRVRACLFF